MNVVIQYQIKNPDIAKTRPMLVLRDISVDMSLSTVIDVSVHMSKDLAHSG